MGIPNFLRQACVQTAVYWGNPVSDGYGGFTYDDPIEIECRWSNKQQLIYEANGTQLVSSANVHLLQDVDLEGLLYLGTIDDIEDLFGDSSEDSSGVWYDPKLIETGLYIIKKFLKTPALRSESQYTRKAILTEWR